MRTLLYFLFSSLIYLFPLSAVEEDFIEQVSSSTIQNALANFPRTIEEINQFTSLAITELENGRRKFNTQSLTHVKYENVVLAWNRLIEPFFWKRVILMFLSLATSDVSFLEKTKIAAEYLDKKLSEACNDEKAISIVLNYVKQVMDNPYLESLHPSQTYLLYKLIESIVDGLSPSHKLRKNAIELQAKFSRHKMLSFTYAKGEAVKKNLPLDKKITILNWNICCFNEGISMFFGGVLPWQYRISRIAHTLQNSHADIICLQEVFSPEANQELYEKLKKNYAHFYMNIGPKVYGFDKESIGIPSGLFVASKYPLKNPHFYSYNAQQTPKIRGYGFFSAEIKNQDTTMARIITTHLQPDSNAQDLEFRHAQLQAILSSITDKTPTFICGDFNIERNGEEFNKELKTHFENCYTGSDWTCCELRNYWWKAQKDVNKFHALGLCFEWIDYFMRLKDHNYESVKFTSTDILLVNNPLKPEEALSDHQALITSITFKEAALNK